MRYGDEVRIRPDLYRDFVLVHVSVRKGIEIETDGRTHHVPEGRVFFSSPKHSIALRWQEDCEQVLIRFPHDLLFRGKSFQVPLSAASLSEPLVVPFVHQLSTLLAMARQPSGLYGFRQWQGALQETLVGFVAASLGVSQHSVPSPETIEIPETRTRDRLESLDAFIRARLDRPIRHIDLEVATGLGHSQLNQLVQKGFGCSPMMLVRQRRLEAVRQSLEADPGQDLTQLSLLYGFDHQGRFAQYYRGQFGEAPSETRRRLRGQRPAGRNG
jgi:AraC-like DNA-binding protein